MWYALSHKFSIRHIIMIDKGKFAQHPYTANESFCKIRHGICVVHRLYGLQMIFKWRIPFCLTGGGSGRVHERSERKTIVLRPGEGVAKKTGALGARTLERGGDFPRL